MNDQWGAPQVPPQFQERAQEPYGQPPPYQQPPYGQQYPPQQYAPAPRRRRHTARNIIGGLGALVVVITGISIVAGGGGHTVNTTGTGGSTGGAGTAAKSTATARTGTAITLAGNGSGEQMSVTVTKVISHATSGDQFTSPPAGDRLYAVQFRLRDTGTGAYSDAPSNGAAVTDSKGQSYQAGIADTAAGCQAFPASENIAPGSSGLGCIVFEVPSKAKITSVQFTLDSGMGPQTGQWDVAG
jgi:Domain of unknown function (DUF4352)